MHAHLKLDPEMCPSIFFKLQFSCPLSTCLTKTTQNLVYITYPTHAIMSTLGINYTTKNSQSFLLTITLTLTLETRRIRGDQIEVFKILNGYENIDSNIFFEIKESKITRGHNYTLVKKQSRLDVRKFSFSQRTINVWNNLSTDCVHASSVNMFKNKIDKYLVKAGYT